MAKKYQVVFFLQIMKIYFFFIFIFCSATSCNNNEIKKKPDIQAIGEYFADIECRAIQLREHWFHLANEIRFIQDTIAKKNDKVEKARLKRKLEELNILKESILQSSLTIADSIHQILDSLNRQYLNDTANKRKFNEVLKSMLQKRGCGEL